MIEHSDMQSFSQFIFIQISFFKKKFHQTFVILRSFFYQQIVQFLSSLHFFFGYGKFLRLSSIGRKFIHHHF